MAAGEVKGSCHGLPPPRPLLQPALPASGPGSRVQGRPLGASYPWLNRQCCPELPGPAQRKRERLLASLAGLLLCLEFVALTPGAPVS